MTFSARVREHIRSNVVGYIALFCFVIGGTAGALPGKNKVDSGDIKKGQVKASDIASKSVGVAKLAPNSVNSSKVLNDSLVGADIDESSLNLPAVEPNPTTLPPSGPAGGDLAGAYPNPTVKESSLDTGGDLTGTVDNAQVAGNAIGDGEISNKARRVDFPVVTLSAAALNTADPPDPGVVSTFPVLNFSGTADESIVLTARLPADLNPDGAVGVQALTSSTSAGNFVIASQVAEVTPEVNEIVTAANTSTSSSNINYDFAGELRSVGGGGSASYEPGDLVRINLVRPAASNGADTLASDVSLYGVAITYTAER